MMGYYINPKDMSKEEWLAVHGVEVPAFRPFDERPSNALPVCLVNNVGLGFTAAGVAYDAREQDHFADPKDWRPRRYFYADIRDLKDVEAIPADFEVKEAKSLD